MTELVGGAALEGIFFSFLRLTAFFVVLPFPGLTAPPQVKVIFAGALAWTLAPEGVQPELTWVGALLEVVVGLSAGFLIRLVFQAFTFGGEAAGTQMGLASIGFFNPLESQITLLGSSFTFIVLGFFALGDGPGRLLVFVYRFLELMPPGSAALSFDAREVVTIAGAELFVLGILAAAPMIAAVFCAQAVLAVLARAVPTLNLLIEGPGLTTAAGVTGLFASVHALAGLVDRSLAHQFEQVGRWMFG